MSMKPNTTLIFATLMLLAFTTGGYAQNEAATAQPANQGSDSTSQAGVSDDTAPVALQAAFTSGQTNPPVAAHHDGLWFSTPNGATQLHVHGYAQADDRMFSDNIHDEGLDTFL